ncbi:PREDICTED: uncharacterized protein LOC109324719 [Crocodylus porosus]|uniref:uncharacterized protein LOC109324719 n=1 Tax=Crocodylus porosus TaxID=8502 RepID=UPI00093A7B96|nr:PREDICTED: uncharacterized protein LOC109324719 [Crocodylus porosus]
MEPRGRRIWQVCIAVLCAGAVTKASPLNTGQVKHMPELEGDFFGTTRETARNTTWIPTTLAGPTEGPTAAHTTNRTDTTADNAKVSSSLSPKYWSPIIFVVLALIVLFFTYRRKRRRGTSSRAASMADSSDSDMPIVPDPDQHRVSHWEKRLPFPGKQRPTDTGTPVAETPPSAEMMESVFCEPDSSSHQAAVSITAEVSDSCPRTSGDD